MEFLEFFVAIIPTGKLEPHTAPSVRCPVFDNLTHRYATGLLGWAALGVLRGSQQLCESTIIDIVNPFAIMLVYFQIPGYALSSELNCREFIRMTGG